MSWQIPILYTLLLSEFPSTEDTDESELPQPVILIDIVRAVRAASPILKIFLDFFIFFPPNVHLCLEKST